MWVLYISKMMVPSVTDATVDAMLRIYRPAHTKLGPGACAVLRLAIRRRIRKTAVRSGVLALYVRNGKSKNFTPTDVAMADFMAGIQKEGALRHRLLHDSVYRNFFDQDRHRGAAAGAVDQPEPHVYEGDGGLDDLGGNDWGGPGDFETPIVAKAVKRMRSPRARPAVGAQTRWALSSGSPRIKHAAPLSPRRLDFDTPRKQRSARVRPPNGTQGRWKLPMGPIRTKHAAPFASRRLEFDAPRRRRSGRARPAAGARRRWELLSGPLGLKRAARPVRERRRPAWLADYHGTIDLRTIKRDFKKAVIPRTRDNLFAAVLYATGDARTVRELREVCADLESDPARFRPDAIQRFKGAAGAKAHASSIRARALGGELELEVLAYATNTIIVVKNGEKLQRYAPRVFDEAGPSRDSPTAVLELSEYYDALLPKGSKGQRESSRTTRQTA